MMQTRAIVIRVDGQDALVESLQSGGCGKCESKDGCGSGKLSQLFGSDPRYFRVRNAGNAQAGDLVEVIVSEGVLLNSALLMYMLPLLFLLLGATAGLQWAPVAASADAYSAVGAFLGLFAGFVVVKVIAVRRRMLSFAQPIILSSPECCTSLHP